MDVSKFKAGRVQELSRLGDLDDFIAEVDDIAQRDVTDNSVVTIEAMSIVVMLYKRSIILIVN